MKVFLIFYIACVVITWAYMVGILKNKPLLVILRVTCVRLRSFTPVTYFSKLLGFIHCRLPVNRII